MRPIGKYGQQEQAVDGEELLAQLQRRVRPRSRSQVEVETEDQKDRAID